MFTLRIEVTNSADGTSALLATSAISASSGRRDFSQADVGLIDPNIYWLTQGGVGDHGYRLDTIFIEQSAAAAGSVAIADRTLPASRVLSTPIADLSAVTDDFGVTSRSFPVPPGYLVRVIGANVTAIILSFTEVPAIADVQYLAVTVINEPPS